MSVPAGPVDVSIIVVSHEHAAFLPVCLGALPAACSGVPYEVIVVDNRSSDGSADVARNACPTATVIVNDRRRGFAANCNTGLARSRGRHVLFLNPDTEASPGSIEMMV